jgi:hypothetical protein
MARRWLLLGAVLCLATVVGPAAQSRATYDFQNLSPPNGATISYSDWVNAGNYVTFTIQPDSNYSCGSEPYLLYVNGVREGRFDTNCSASVYLRTPGSYAWRTDLLAFDATPPIAAIGSTTTFTVAGAPADTTAPVVLAVHSTLNVGRTGRLLYRVSDDSGVASVALGVLSGKTPVWSKTLPTVQVRAPSPLYSAAWRPARRGIYVFCVVAKDAAGNPSRPSCATVRVV